MTIFMRKMTTKPWDFGPYWQARALPWLSVVENALGSRAGSQGGNCTEGRDSGWPPCSIGIVINLQHPTTQTL